MSSKRKTSSKGDSSKNFAQAKVDVSNLKCSTDSSKKILKYSLYQTFSTTNSKDNSSKNSDLNNQKGNLTIQKLSSTQKKSITNANLNLDQSIAFFRLILEHSLMSSVKKITDMKANNNKCNDDKLIIDFEDGTLPYGGEETEDGPRFNIDNLPEELQMILFKFVGVCQNN